MAGEAKYTELWWEWLDRTLVAGPKQTHLLYAHEAPGLGNQADAVRRLIATAPELLDALHDAAVAIEALLSAPDDESRRPHAKHFAERARSLVAKATGIPH